MTSRLAHRAFANVLRAVERRSAVTDDTKPIDAEAPNQDETAQGQSQPNQTTEGETVTLPLEEWHKGQKRANERDEFLELAQRTQADFANYKQRQNQQQERERSLLRGGLVMELLPILDNLERANTAAANSGDVEGLIKGVSMVQMQFLELLKQKFEVVPIQAVGEPFDPNKHDGVTQMPSEEHPADTVTQVVETGYMIQDRVLRPAKVIVSSGPPE